MKYLFFLFLIPAQITSNDAITDSTIVKESAKFHFIWEDPKVTDGCWKIGQDKRITKAPNVSKKDCKKMQKAGEWFELIEVGFINQNNSWTLK